MVDTNMRRRFAPFVGFLFCSFLTLMTLGPLDVGGGSNPNSLTTLLCFLPICFLFMGFTLKEQHDRIQALEAALALRDKNTE